MGMYSYLENESISLRKGKVGELKKFLKEKMKETNYNWYYEAVEVNDNSVSLQGLSDGKIISYWYDEFIIFLYEIADFIEGELFFTFETGDQTATIEFRDGEVFIELGVMEYTKHDFHKEFIQKIIDANDEDHKDFINKVVVDKI